MTLDELKQKLIAEGGFEALPRQSFQTTEYYVFRKDIKEEELEINELKHIQLYEQFIKK